MKEHCILNGKWVFNGIKLMQPKSSKTKCKLASGPKKLLNRINLYLHSLCFYDHLYNSTSCIKLWCTAAHIRHKYWSKIHKAGIFLVCTTGKTSHEHWPNKLTKLIKHIKNKTQINHFHYPFSMWIMISRWRMCSTDHCLVNAVT